MANGAEEPAPVDFDALHAALGDLPRVDDIRPTPPALKSASPESHGRSNASYASARPRTIPPSLAPPEDPNEPAVIVAQDDTVPLAAPKMTIPMGPPRTSPSGSHAVHGHAGASAHPFTPQPFPAKANAGQLTIPMVNRPRRPRSPTIVVRPRGPTRQQKLAVFMAMLLLLVGGGVAVVVIVNPDLIPGLGVSKARPATAPPPSVVVAAPPPSAIPSAVPSVSTTPVVTPSATFPPPATASASPSPTPSAVPSVKPPRKRQSTIPVPTPGF